MNRVDKFKQIRNKKRKYYLAVSVFFILLTAGIFCADYSINDIMKDEEGIAIISLYKTGNTNYRLSIMNKGLDLDTGYLSKDYEKLKMLVIRLLKPES